MFSLLKSSIPSRAITMRQVSSVTKNESESGTKTFTFDITISNTSIPSEVTVRVNVLAADSLKLVMSR